MVREQEFEKVKETMQVYYHRANWGLFNTRNVVGDTMTTILKGRYFTLDICYFWKYFEVFGTTEEEFKELQELYKKLGE